MGKKSKAIDRQTQELIREADLEAQRAQEAAARQQVQWEQQRASDEQRYQQQLTAQQAEAERQRQAQDSYNQQMLAGQQSQLQAQQQAAAEELARQQAKAEQARKYAEGRNTLIDKARGDINAAYSGFDDNYFHQFAQDFVNYYKPQLGREADQSQKQATYSYADSGNLRSTAAAKSFGDLNRQRAEKEGEIANSAIDNANSFRGDIDQQKSDALSLLFSSGAVGADSLPDGSDAGSALAGIGSQLGALTTTQANKAKNIKAPSFSAGAMNLSLNTRLPGQRAA
jgi:hypothetical protein